MSTQEEFNFTVYEAEPLLRFIASKFNPVALSITFLFAISLTLVSWAALSVPSIGIPPERYLSFFENLSWSLSMIFLFPFVVGLTLSYYQDIPGLFRNLFRTVAIPGQENHIVEFSRRLRRKFNSYLVSLIILLITLLLNGIYFRQMLGQVNDISWLTTGELLKTLFQTPNGFTPVGLYAAIIQVVLIYWVLNLVWRSVILSWALYELFHKPTFSIRIEPLHPDGCCGLSEIGRVATKFNFIAFCLGIYVSLKVIDKIIMQQSSLGADIGNPVMLIGYAILAPVLFFAPLYAAHDNMKTAKEEFLLPVSRRCEELFAHLKTVPLEGKGLEMVQQFKEIDKIRNDMKSRIPVWPFDFKSLEAFAGTVAVPILPVVLPFVIQFLTR